MNTLTLIKKQIQKAAALHDAQISHTAYRGVVYECKQGADEVHGTCLLYTSPSPRDS